MTDGKISDKEVESFATIITAQQIHGTPAVVTLSGRPHGSPFQCNVSVGVSVFGVVPHVIFLFHNIDTRQVYVLQAKGCFLEILPKDKKFIQFTPETSWSDLVNINYLDLMNTRVLASVKLRSMAIQLPDGSRLNMNDIINNTMPDSRRVVLVCNGQAMGTVISASKALGLPRLPKHG